MLSWAVSGLLVLMPPQAIAATRHGSRAAPVDWTMVASETPEGGVRIGNPRAPARLVEYGSFTCPHCAAFAKEAFPAIRDRYVRSGKLSFEFRAALRDGGDLVAAIVARCAGPQRFFGTAEAVFAAQADWEQRAIDYGRQHAADPPPADPAVAFQQMASASGLAAIGAHRSLAPAALQRCLADPKLRDMLGKAATDAWNVRQIGGTPAFYLNDDKLADVYGWAALEPYLRAALKN